MASFEPRHDDPVMATQAVVAWYFATYHGRDDDMGMARTFGRRDAVGHFAVDLDDVARSEPAAMFRLFVSAAMFQRLRDAIVMQTLRGIPPDDAHELTSLQALLELVDDAACEHARSNAALQRTCDLTKDAAGRATCDIGPHIPCHLKRHSMLLRRYGHFGKVPSSAALMVREAGAGNLVALKDEVVAGAAGDATLAAVRLEEAISRTWRIASKIAAMFLSLVTAPGMGFGNVPWSTGIDWTRYVVIDRNVDLFLESLGYAGSGTYDARRDAVLELARHVDVSHYRPDLPAYHPRLVQQAMFMFMSKSNRKLAPIDCSHHGRLCGLCPTELRHRCGLEPERATQPSLF